MSRKNTVIEPKSAILIVEDDMALASNLQDVLEKEGYSAAVAHDGRSALTLCAEKVLDLALIDIKLPDVLGVDLVEKLTELSPVTEYIIITGYPSLETAVAAIGQERVVGYETKPLDMRRLISLIRQFTHRKWAEEALRASEERYRQLVELSPDAIAVHSEGQIVYINTAGATLLRAANAEQLIGKPIMGFVHPDYRETVENRPRVFREEGKRVPMIEEKFIRLDGTDVDVEVAAIPFTYQGKPAVQAVVRDITERKRAEEAIKLAYAELDQVFNTAASSMRVTDKDFNVLRINRAFSTLFGISKDEAVGRKCYKVLPGADCHTDDCPLTRIIGGEERVEYEVEKQRSDGVRISCHLAATPNRRPDGQLAGMVQSFTDITERKQAQEKLQRSYEKLQRAMEGTKQAFALTTEMRDPYTSGHQRRVTKLACAIASEMSVSKERIEGIDMAGSIHDIGKMYVPTEILCKPGQLTEVEFGLIKVHPQAGHDILSSVELTGPIAQIVLQHHERMNGSGYPSGLSGEDILLEARILAVADVVEAMSSHRPYRPGYVVDKALLEIIQNRGVLYDRSVVDACMTVFTEKGFQFD